MPLTCSKVCMRAEEQNAFRGTKALIILSILSECLLRGTPICSKACMRVTE